MVCAAYSAFASHSDYASACDGTSRAKCACALVCRTIALERRRGVHRVAGCARHSAS